METYNKTIAHEVSDIKGYSPSLLKTVVLLISLSFFTFKTSYSQLLCPTITVAAKVTTAGCNGGTATLTATASGGVGPFTYSLNGGAFVSTNVFTGLSAGVYVVTAKDSKGCLGISASVTVTLPAALNLNVSVGACINGLATLTATVTGGVGPFWFSLNGGAYINSNIFNVTVSGSYTVSVKDANGCIATSATVLVNCTPVNCPVIDVDLTGGIILCNGGTTSLIVNASGGADLYMYSLNGGAFQNSNVFSNLGAGTYTVKVRDVNGCLASASITISQPPALAITVSAGECVDGTKTLTANASGGTAPYSYSLDGGAFQSSNVFSGVGSGTHTIRVKDANGCIKTSAAVVVSCAPANCPVIDVNLTAGLILCNGGRTSLIVSASGGTAPYSYSLNGGANQSSNVFSSVGGGVHVVKVIDAKGCVSASVSITISQPPALAITVSAGACVDGTKTLTANASGGTAPYSYSLDGGAFQSGNVFSGVGSGTHTIRVKDANGCIKTSAAIVVSCAPVSCPTIKVDVAAGLILCTGGRTSIIVTASGGVGPYLFSVNGSVYQSSNVFAGLAAGVYIVKVKDAKGCVGTSASITITQPVALNVSLSASVCIAGVTVLTANVSGGVGPYLFSLNGSAYQSSNTFAGITAGVYVVKVMDANGCIKVSASITVNCVGSTTLNTGSTNLMEGKSSVVTASPVLNESANEISTRDKPVSIQASPNPFNDRVRFTIRSKMEGNSNLVLFNTAGAQIANVYQGYISSNSTKSIDFTVPPKDRVNLIYVLTVGTHRETGKLISIK